MSANNGFRPFIAPESSMAEFTIKSVLTGAAFGILFGAATVYLALKAGLTVSASIPIAVIAITLGRKLLKTTILENNIIQTTGSAGESVAAGVVFTLPGFLFLSEPASASFFNYFTILLLAIFGGILGTLMMIPLRKSLIVKEHGTLPYPEGTACASVLKAGEKGGDFAKTAFLGLGFAAAYAVLQKVLHVIAETPRFATEQANRFFPSARLSGDVTPEYLGVGYIIGPRIAGVLVAGGVLSWLVLIPLLSSLVPADMVAAQLVNLGYLKNLNDTALGWDPVNRNFADWADVIYLAYVRQIGAGAVAAGGFITLIKTIPTIIASFKGSISSIKKSGVDGVNEEKVPRTERDLSIKVVGIGSLILILCVALMPSTLIPGQNIGSKLLLGLLIIIFGAFFVTVSSRIVGLIGSSNNPISGMTIATLMGTCLVFIAVNWTGYFYEPMALVVGGMICIAAANAGATSQDLKTGYIVGATPRYQQLALFVGVIVSSIAIGATIKILDTPTAAMAEQGIKHAIGTPTYPAPQGTLMATLIKGILTFNLDWQFVLVGVFIAITLELCGIKSLSFAVGAYLPLSTTLPIFIGGAIRGLVERKQKKRGEHKSAEEEELSKGSLFATGLVAGGALMGVFVAILTATDTGIENASLREGIVNGIGAGGYKWLGVAFFAFMAFVLYRIGVKKERR